MEAVCSSCKRQPPDGGKMEAGLVAGSGVLPSRLGRYVRLNVGGSLFYTTLDTLTKKDTMLRAMFSGEVAVITDEQGWVLIDRSGKYFGTVLDYLRDGEVPIPNTYNECVQLLAEARYYLVTELEQAVLKRLEQLKEANLSICKVPIITSPAELHQVMDTTGRPVIRFMFNRSNNKYSYTSSSEENLLKNLELFDKLSLRFQDRVLFVKDVAGTEICTWYFYGNRKNQAEVCCQSIVYGTDRKQMKIEFPEVRVYDEVLNIMLYEDRYCDAKHAAAAKRRAANFARKGKVQASMHAPVQGQSSGGEAAPSEETAPSASDDDLEVEKVEKEKVLPRVFSQSLRSVCRIPVVTAPGELENILSSTWRPIIRFVYNRSNNKYSYTSSSDENFLRNVELFDTLSIRFQERVLFIRDVVGTEVCTWFYYGHGKKQAEISCQSIVYATEKRQLKVDFPEAKILEEAINIMLFEDRFLDAERAAQAQRRARFLRRADKQRSQQSSDDDIDST